MKILKYAFLTLLVLAMTFFIVAYFYIEGKKPTYEGEFSLPELKEQTTVYFDDYGVPHIDAATDEDAFVALGYLHAQDRLWQMELIRRIAPGRLSEVFGKDLVETDRFFKTLGITYYSRQSAEDLRQRKGPVLDMANAYLKGVNHFIETGFSPTEYDIIGIEKTPFTLENLYDVLGYMSFSFAIAQKTEPVVSYLQQLPPAYLEALAIDIPPSEEIIKSNAQDTAYLAMATAMHRHFKRLPVAPFIGSNSWVISPEKSATGAVIFSNDPHIAFSQPAVWYEAHVKSPSLNYYGYHLAGVPFATLAHNENIAVGLTMFENDDLDFYRELVNPANDNQYKSPEGWQDFESREETITVKDGDDETFTVQISRHGPIMNNAIKGLENEAPIAAWWTFFQFPNRLFEATHQMAKAKTMEEARAGAALIHAPGLNVMYGDKAGNIAWWASGKLVKRPAHVNSKSIIDGSDPANDPVGYYDFAQNPQAENPSSGFVYSANNQSAMNIKDSLNLYPGYYLPESRAARIVQVLEAKDKVSVDDVKALFLDSQNPQLLTVAQSFIAAVSNRELSPREQEAIDLLTSWDGSHELDTKGAALIYAWVIHAFEKAMLDDLILVNDELGEVMFESFMQTHLMKRSLYSFFDGEDSPWWDDRSTDPVESRNDIIYQALGESLDYLNDRFGPDALQNSWSAFHTVSHGHALGAVEALAPIFNVGPFMVSGSDMAVNNLGFSFTKEGLFNITYGPSTRRIIDFANVGASESILPTGQSGNIFSDHYDDQAVLYHEGKWRPMLFDQEDIQENVRKLMLLPADQ